MFERAVRWTVGSMIAAACLVFAGGMIYVVTGKDELRRQQLIQDRNTEQPSGEEVREEQDDWPDPQGQMTEGDEDA